MKHVLLRAVRPAAAVSAIAVVLATTVPSLGQRYNYAMPGYISSRGDATGGPSGGADQRRFVKKTKKAKMAKVRR